MPPLPFVPSLLVPEAGLEPARSCPQWILSPSRLPIPTLRQTGECNRSDPSGNPNTCSSLSFRRWATASRPSCSGSTSESWRLAQQESRTSAELEMLRSLNDDFQRDAAVSGHPSDRADAQRATCRRRAVRESSRRAGRPPGPAGIAAGELYSPGSATVERVLRSATPSHQPMPTLALLDGHSLAYRAFFALPPDLATQSGQMTNSVYGFTRMLLKLVGDHHPDAIAIAWDVGRDTFRLAEYSEYKANRSSAPDQFRSQLPLIREVMDALGLLTAASGGLRSRRCDRHCRKPCHRAGMGCPGGNRRPRQLPTRGRSPQGALHPPRDIRHGPGRRRVR